MYCNYIAFLILCNYYIKLKVELSIVYGVQTSMALRFLRTVAYQAHQFPSMSALTIQDSRWIQTPLNSIKLYILHPGKAYFVKLKVNKLVGSRHLVRIANSGDIQIVSGNIQIVSGNNSGSIQRRHLMCLQMQSFFVR